MHGAFWRVGFDLIGLDFDDAGEDGLSLTRGLRETHANANPARWTAKAETEKPAYDGLEAGADDYRQTV